MDILSSIISTLNTVEVHGKDNLSKLLGCISALEELKKSMAAKSEAKTDG